MGNYVYESILYIIFLLRYRNLGIRENIMKFEKRNNNNLDIKIYLTKLNDSN